MAHGSGPAPVPQRARRADAARNAELLLSAAKELFERDGPDAALDEVARRAGLGNATLYRHFPTRGDLLVAVYADEVAELCRGGGALAERHEPGDALFGWLDDFVVHVATKRALALAVTEGPDERRTELFARWHESMRSTAEGLLVRARAAGAVRGDLAVGDLLALVSGAAMTAADVGHARRLLGIMRHGFESSA
ncbi:TetR/AcrR family transcriptional regulator [Streptomyces sp. NBC_01198]|uniref:TetR/AcrR family transcriptional regulator n=1 Tax=Streptomyces sp. NBC_01198 TaxID=2903769 RepID=UPI002E0EFEEB|nr:TetR/AcrR family transcriptional regulator [Streptomyces sp. NBC_01198]